MHASYVLIAQERVRHLPGIVDDLTDLLGQLDGLTSPEQAQLMLPLVFQTAAHVEAMKNALNALGYRLPFANFVADPPGYFRAMRDHFEKLVPEVGDSGDADLEMFKAALAGRH